MLELALQAFHIPRRTSQYQSEMRTSRLPLTGFHAGCAAQSAATPKKTTVAASRRRGRRVGIASFYTPALRCARAGNELISPPGKTVSLSIESGFGLRWLFNYN